MNKVLMALTAITWLSMSACSKEEQKGANSLTKDEIKEGWQLLFDGSTSKGWHIYNEGDVPSAWVVQNGELVCLPADSTDTLHGDLVTDREFENFDLKFEWKISEAGNSGVFINVQEDKEISTAWASGPEYQLLENTHPDFETSKKKRAGCLYGFQEQLNEAPTRPVGEWNQSRITQENGKIKFYLNDILTAEEDLTSQEWKETVAATWFKNFPEFGNHKKGRIALQDWSKGVAFRNIMIKEN